MKLLSINGNSKLAKTNKATSDYLFAGLSLYRDHYLCPASKAAGCHDACLVSAGRGRFSNVIEARQRKTDLFRNDFETFKHYLMDDLEFISRKARRENKQPVVRLNVMSDIAWEQFGIPQAYPEIMYYDYTKRADRLGKTPPNYHLTFSYSGARLFRRSVEKALKTDTNLAVVFSGGLPARFLGRPVVDGDLHDIRIDDTKGLVIGLRAKGQAKTSDSDFVVRNPELIGD
jgi:hypothetical protein